MAKGDVTLKFDAQTAAAIQNILAARNALEASAVTARKFGEDVAKAGDKAASGLEKAGEAAGEAATDFLKIGTAAGTIVLAAEVVTKTFEGYFERMEARAEGLKEKVEGVNAALAVGGQQEAAPEARKFIDELGQSKIGEREIAPSEARSMFEQVSRAVPLADEEAKQRATTLAAKGLAAHEDQATAVKLGTTYLELSRQKAAGGFKGESDEELQNLAYQATVGLPGGLDPKSLKFLSQAGDKKQALNLLIAAARSNEPTRGLSAIEAIADEDFTPDDVAKLQRKKRKPREFTSEDDRKLRLSQIPKEERIAAIMADPTLAPNADRLLLKTIAQGASQVTPSPTLDEQIEKPADEAQKQAEILNNAKVQQERVKKRGALDDLAHQARIEQRKAELLSKYGETLYGLFPNILEAADDIHRPAAPGSYSTEPLTSRNPMNDFLGTAPQQQSQEAIDAQNPAPPAASPPPVRAAAPQGPPAPSATSSPPVTQPAAGAGVAGLHADASAALLRELQQQTGHLRALSSGIALLNSGYMTRRDTTLSRDVEGQA